MFTNDVIEHLSEWPKDGLVYPVEKIMSMVINSMKFHLGELPDSIEHLVQKGAAGNRQLFFGDNHVHFPYPTVSITYSGTAPTIVKNNRLRSTRRCILASKINIRITPNNNLIKYLIIPFSYYDERKIWTPPIMGLEYSDDFSSAKFFQFYSNEMFTRNKVFSLPPDEISAIKNDIICEASILNMFLKILECKNITQESITPNQKINKKRIKKKKLSLFEYKILKVSLPKNNTIKNNTSGLDTNSLNRVHLCRGHFKEYTNERPLFGKYTGRYWWQPIVRGKGDGVVEKEYLIDMK